jgi:hypothetical protein
VGVSIEPRGTQKNEGSNDRHRPIEKEITYFMSRGVCKPVSRKNVVEDMKGNPPNVFSRRKRNEITLSGTNLV